MSREVCEHGKLPNKCDFCEVDSDVEWQHRMIGLREALRQARIEGVKMERERLRRAVKDRIDELYTSPEPFPRVNELTGLLADHFHVDPAEVAKP